MLNDYCHLDKLETGEEEVWYEVVMDLSEGEVLGAVHAPGHVVTHAGVQACRSKGICWWNPIKCTHRQSLLVIWRGHCWGPEHGRKSDETFVAGILWWEPFPGLRFLLTSKKVKERDEKINQFPHLESHLLVILCPLNEGAPGVLHPAVKHFNKKSVWW